MKIALLCCVVLLAGSASCSPAEEKINLPELIQIIEDKFPEIFNVIPDIIDRIKEIIAIITDKIPDAIETILDKLPEIIAQIPEAIEKIRELILEGIEKLPELIPIILERIPEIIAKIPEIKEKIKEILEGLDRPDWLPTLPDLEKPEWWPELPSLPEINKGVPGTLTSVSEYPSIVQIEVGTGPIWVQGCVGNVLTNSHVLSAARCFGGLRYDARFRRVRAGASERYVGGAIMTIERAINHPEYNFGSFEADISVVRLSNFLTFTPNIQQTAILPAGFVLPSGLSVVLASWGSTAQGSLRSDRELYKIDLQISETSDCADRWSAFSKIVNISSDVICVSRPETGGRNSDIRDVGAPVYYDNILSGVVSFGAPIGNQYFPVVVTNVASYTDWIVDNAV